MRLVVWRSIVVGIALVLSTSAPQAATSFAHKCANLYNEYSPEKRIEGCTKGIAEEPDRAVLYFWRGAAYYQLGDLKPALKDYDRALALDSHPDNFAYYYRAIIRDKLGKYEGALSDYRIWRDEYGNNPDVSADIRRLERRTHQSE